MSAALVAVASMAMPLASGAYADTGSTGGAMHAPDPNPLSAAERKILAQKMLQFDAAKKQHSGVSASWTASTVWADIFEEPQYSPWASESANWCGPGSTTAVVTNWNSVPENFTSTTYGNGGQGYLTWLAKAGVSGIGPMVVTGSNGKPITYDYTLRSTVNNQIGGSYYYTVVGVGGLANFQNYIWVDIGLNYHPFFTVVWTVGLYGWGTYGAAHYQWLTFGSTDSDMLTYGDSAGDNATPGSNNSPYGYHNWTLSTYYNSNVHNANVWDEIIW